jgi:hypothetical protein
MELRYKLKGTQIDLKMLWWVGSFNNLWGFLKWEVKKLNEVWLIMGQKIWSKI